MPTAVVLQDLNRRITIVSDVEHGATGSGDSGIEIMLGIALFWVVLVLHMLYITWGWKPRGLFKVEDKR